MSDNPTSETPDVSNRIQEAYLNELKAEGRPPVSIFKLCQSIGITERDFFSEFSFMEAVEIYWWSDLMDRVIKSVESGNEWIDFSARQRTLAFLFAFTAAALDHRSLLLMRIGNLGPLKPVPVWSGLETRFERFAESILARGRQSGEIVSRGPVSSVYPRAFRFLLRSVITFNLKDDSAKFERTDAFIEKSVAVLFDLMGRQVLDSGFDLLRFLLPGIRLRS
jgi:hypothetical protein